MKVKFVDQTRKTIQKESGVKKITKKAIPGVRICHFDSSKKKAEATAVSTLKLSKEDTFVNYPFFIEDAALFQKELSDLIQPAASYGISGLENDASDWGAPVVSTANFWQSLAPLTGNFTEQDISDDKSHSKTSSWIGDQDGYDDYNLSEEADGNDDDEHEDMATDMKKYPKPLTESQVETVEPYELYNELRLFTHYSHVMSRFYSVKDPSWNFYSYVADRLASRYMPLKYAILGWSALHISIIESSSSEIGNKYYNIALVAMVNYKDKIPIELFLVTAYFLVQFDIMAGTRHTYQILRFVWSTLRIGRLFESKSRVPKLTPFAYQIIIWLLYVDIRSALFSGNITFPDYIFGTSTEVDHGRKHKSRVKETKMDRNPNIEYLSTSETYEKRAVSNIFSKSKNLLKGIYGSWYPDEYTKDDSLQENILVLMVRNMMMFGRLIRLRNWLNQCGNSTEFDTKSLVKEISILQVQNQKLTELCGSSRMSAFHVLIENALMNAIIIYFDRICYPDIRTNKKCQKAASEILKIAVQLKTLRPKGTPGSTQWPFPLFIAGVETTDVVYQNWIAKELSDSDKEGWGLNLGKTRILFKECIAKQEETGRRIDIGDVMARKTGVFVL